MLQSPVHLQKPRPNEPSPEEMTDLEELEQFAKTFKQRRIKLGKFSGIFNTTAVVGKNNKDIVN